MYFSIRNFLLHHMFVDKFYIVHVSLTWEPLNKSLKAEQT